MNRIDKIVVDGEPVPKAELRTYLAALEQSEGISFLQAGAGAAARSVQEKLREARISVKDFRCDDGRLVQGDGVHDDTTGIRRAWAQLSAAGKSGNTGIYGTGVYVGTTPVLLFPSGIYKVTDFITPDTPQSINYASFVGENAIIVAAPGVVIFGGVGYGAVFEGIVFRGGACAISCRTNNIDTTRIDVLRCEFHEQTVAQIRIDGKSNSTLLNIDRCKFVQRTSAGYVGHFQTGDFINITNCWITCHSPVAFHNGVATLHVKNCAGVPGGAMAKQGGRWCDNYTSVIFDDFRFGGEDGGTTVVRNYAALSTKYPILPTRVSIKNSAVFSVRNIVEFVKLPNMFEFVDNAGMIDSAGFLFDQALTPSDFAQFATHGKLNLRGNFTSGNTNLLGVRGSSRSQVMGEQTFMTMAARHGLLNAPDVERLSVQQIWGLGDFGTGNWTQAGAAATAIVADEYGLASWKVTGTADGQSKTRAQAAYLNARVLAGGRIYTLVLVSDGVTLVASAGSAIVRIGATVHLLEIPPGRAVHSIPFVYYNMTGSADPTLDSLEITFINLRKGDVLGFSRAMLVSGSITWKHEVAILRSAGVPTPYSPAVGNNTGYARGDISYRTGPASNEYVADVCTGPGMPGTWRGFGPVQTR